MSVDPRIFTYLMSLYNEHHRHYHNMNHILNMFNTANDLSYALTEEQTLAIWFHDAVYDPTKTDNEEKSIELAEEILKNEHCSDYSIGVISQIIADTKLMRPTIPDSEIVLDLDVFGFTTNDCLKNTELIRREYHQLSNKDWLVGRIRFLTNFLEEKRKFNDGHLFFSNVLKSTTYDQDGLQNINDEISNLQEQYLNSCAKMAKDGLDVK